MPYNGGLWRVPIRGGNWNNEHNAGVFNCNLNNARSNSNSNIGFRSALQCLMLTWCIISTETAKAF